MPTLKYLDPASGTYKAIGTGAPGPAGPPGPPGPTGTAVVEPTYACTLRANAVQTMTTSVETSIVYAAATSVDPMGMWDGATLVTIPKDGLYTITFQYAYAGTTGAGSRISLIKINGTTYKQYYHPVITSLQTQGTLAFDIFLTTGDTVQARQYQSTGADLTTPTTLAYMPSLTVAKTPEFAPAGGAVVVDPTYALSMRLAAVLAVPNNANGTVIPFDTVDYADGLSMTAGIFTAPVDGYYQISAKAAFEANATGFRRIRFILGSSSAVPGLEYSTPAAGSIGTSVSMARTLKLLAGDTVSIQVDHNAGATLNISGGVGYTSVDITKVPQSFSGSAVSTYGERNYGTSRAHGAALSIPSGGSITPIPFDTLSYDDGIPLVADGFPVPVAGHYVIEGVVTFAGQSGAGVGVRNAYITINGGSHTTATVTPNATGQSVSITLSQTIKLAAGDIIRLSAYQTQGVALALAGGAQYNRISIAKVPAPVINGAAASGVWGVAPLAGFGTDDSIGRETYIDGLGQLRSNPDVVSGKLPTDLSPTWPTGTTVFYVPNADAALWPGGTMVVTHKTYNNVIAQWCYLWSAAAPKAWYRNGTSAAWSPWQQVVGESVPYATASGVATMPAVAANAGASLTVSFPAGRFTQIPVVTATAASNGYGFATVSVGSTASMTVRYYNPTASVPTNPQVHWTAIQMTPTSASG